MRNPVVPHPQIDGVARGLQEAGDFINANGSIEAGEFLSSAWGPGSLAWAWRKYNGLWEENFLNRILGRRVHLAVAGEIAGKLSGLIFCQLPVGVRPFFLHPLRFDRVR
jgi:hypothetical protein